MSSAPISAIRAPGRRRTPASHTRPLEMGGLIAIGGPPLGGKGLLAQRLAECLPHAVKLEAIDDLSRARPYWLPHGPGGRVLANPTAAMLQRARQLWRRRRAGYVPTILVATRFASAAERRSAKTAARLVGMRFLFVEARSRDERALRRIPMSFLSREDLLTRIERYEAALRSYRPLNRAEAALLPGLRIARAQARLEEAVDRVIAAWRP